MPLSSQRHPGTPGGISHNGVNNLKVTSRPRTREKTDQGFDNSFLLELVPDFVPTPLDECLIAIRDEEISRR